MEADVSIFPTGGPLITSHRDMEDLAFGVACVEASGRPNDITVAVSFRPFRPPQKVAKWFVIYVSYDLHSFEIIPSGTYYIN